jgi:hypothetical protein
MHVQISGFLMTAFADGEYLLSDEVVDHVERVIEDLRSNQSVVTPALVDRVRTHICKGQAERARLLIELATGTMRAERLGKRRHLWLFTNQMAEQSTHPDIAAYHAQAFSGCEHVLEICTGAALDTFALSRVAARVTTYEADALIHACSSGNLRRSGAHNVTCINERWTGSASVPADGVWADPSRREQQQRKRTAAEYEPPLFMIPTAPIVGIKVGPGDIVDATGYASEYIGFGKECRERILWKGNNNAKTWVTLVHEGTVGASRRLAREENQEEASRWLAREENQEEASRWLARGEHQVGASRWLAREHRADPQPQFIIEPHNALIASGMLTQFFEERNISTLDPRIGYGITEHEPPASPWYTAYKILHMEDGASERRMQERIYELGWGPDTVIKKRGWDKDPEVVRSRLTFVEGGHPGVIIIARVGDGHVTMWTQRVASITHRGTIHRALH